MKIYVDADAYPIVRIVEKLQVNMGYHVFFCVTPIMCSILIIVRW